jgi:hypothetical protein
MRMRTQVFPGLLPVYWIEAVWWGVVLDPQDRQIFSACPLSLITDYSEFLIILNVQAAPETALRIYRRRDHPGELTGGEGPDHGVQIEGNLASG